jgi:glc operon protein GlcG
MLDLATAERVIRAAMARAEEMGVKFTIAVVDEGGRIVQLTRMDGANFLSPEIAAGKAVTAAAWRMPSAEVEKRGLDRAAFFGSVATASRGTAVIGRGALPIVIDGRVVGAAGASGGTSEEDEEVVRAGIDAVAS